MIPRTPTPAQTRRGNNFLAPTPEAPRPRIKLLTFKPLVKNSFRAFVTLELPHGLRLIDCPVLISHGRAWISLPSKPLLDQDGQKRDVNGKSAFAPVPQWRNRGLSHQFSDAAIELIRAAHPSALDGAGS
jgi:hypothetical protein